MHVSPDVLQFGVGGGYLQIIKEESLTVRWI